MERSLYFAGADRALESVDEARAAQAEAEAAALHRHVGQGNLQGDLAAEGHGAGERYALETQLHHHGLRDAVAVRKLALPPSFHRGPGQTRGGRAGEQGHVAQLLLRFGRELGHANGRDSRPRTKPHLGLQVEESPRPARGGEETRRPLAAGEHGQGVADEGGPVGGEGCGRGRGALAGDPRRARIGGRILGHDSKYHIAPDHGQGGGIASLHRPGAPRARGVGQRAEGQGCLHGALLHGRRVVLGSEKQHRSGHGGHEHLPRRLGGRGVETQPVRGRRSRADLHRDRGVVRSARGLDREDRRSRHAQIGGHDGELRRARLKHEGEGAANVHPIGAGIRREAPPLQGYPVPGFDGFWVHGQHQRQLADHQIDGLRHLLPGPEQDGHGTHGIRGEGGHAEAQARGLHVEDLRWLPLHGEDQPRVVEASALHRDLLARQGHVGLEGGDAQGLQHLEDRGLRATPAHLDGEGRAPRDRRVGHHDRQAGLARRRHLGRGLAEAHHVLRGIGREAVAHQDHRNPGLAGGGLHAGHRRGGPEEQPHQEPHEQHDGGRSTAHGGRELRLDARKAGEGEAAAGLDAGGAAIVRFFRGRTGPRGRGRGRGGSRSGLGLWGLGDFRQESRLGRGRRDDHGPGGHVQPQLRPVGLVEGIGERDEVAIQERRHLRGLRVDEGARVARVVGDVETRVVPGHLDMGGADLVGAHAQVGQAA